MKKLTFFILAAGLTCCCIVLYAQTMPVYRGSTLYDLHRFPTSSAANLENLFLNWNVENTGLANAGDIELVSYTYHGRIQDSTEIARYAESMTAPGTPFLSIYKQPLGDTLVSVMKVDTLEQIINSVPEGEARDAMAGQIRELTASLCARSLEPGYRVFTVDFNYLGTPMETYVFCHPLSCEVVLDMFFKEIIHKTKFADQAAETAETAAPEASSEAAEPAEQ